MDYELSAVSAACPVCACGEGRLLYAVNAADAAGHYVTRRENPERHEALRRHIAELWKGGRCELVRCTHCGFTFAHPYTAGDVTFYTLAYERTGYPEWKWEFQITRDTLQKLGLRDFHLLEVGAGNGAFVQRVAPSLTPKVHVLTTEFSDYGAGAIKDCGIACLREDFRAISQPALNGRFDVVCLFQVLEHLDRLDTLFAQINQFTKPAAHVFFAVPNDRIIQFNEQHDGLLDMPPNHIGRWTREAFSIFGKRHGWSLAAHEIEPESLASKFKLFVKYRVYRARQKEGTLVWRARGLRNRFARKLAMTALLPLYAFSAAPLLLKLKAPDYGHSQWVHFIRDN